MKTIDHIASAFLRRILQRMKQLGVNQSELAKRMKVSKPYITKVLRQDVNFSFRTAAKLACALEMDFIPGLQERRPVKKTSSSKSIEQSEQSNNSPPLTSVNQKVYNTPHQMTARTDRSDFSRYSPAYAMGRERFFETLS